MPIYQYRNLNVNIADNDSEYKGYFEAASEGRLVVKKCQDCGLLRGEPGPGCPWCTSLNWEWQTVSGKGTIYSYQIVAHTVMPAFRDWAPFAIVLVELDEQRGQPDQYDGLRITANLVDENLEPEKEENVAIGSRVGVVFVDVDEGFSLPQFKLSGEPPQGPVWSHTAQ
jgi:uncharacterized OB-fold protein